MSDPNFICPVDDQPLWKHLWLSLRERLHPSPVPELKLESKPIPVKSIWTEQPSTRQRLGSLALHLAVIGILMLPLWRPVRQAIHQEAVVFIPTLLAPGPSLPKMKHLASGGSPLHKLAPPKLAPVNTPAPLVAPPVKLTPTIADANLPLPAFGDPGRIPGPPGNSAGLNGAGPGGPGTDANGGGDCLGGPCAVGGDVSQPVILFDPDPQYTDAARKAKYQGTVVVKVVIGADGHVYDPQVVQPLGLGLDQKAIDAVVLWRFTPAKRHGLPVRVAANIEVNFRLY